MRESYMRRRVIKILRKAGLDPVPVENLVGPGTPDINYIEGWLELKQLDAWPVRENSPVVIRHLTLQQKIWIRSRASHGGRVHLLLHVDGTWLLFDAAGVEKLLRIPKKKILEIALREWHSWGKLSEELPGALTHES